MEKSGIFNSSNGDRAYNATDFAAYFGKLVTNGVFLRTATNLQVVHHAALTVLVKPGSAWINGYVYENTEDLELPLALANGIHPRIDRVVVQWSAVDREIRLTALTGIASSAPVPPALTRTDIIYELGIADITIPKGAVATGPHDIADTRLNRATCGTVNSLINAVYE